MKPILLLVVFFGCSLGCFPPDVVYPQVNINKPPRPPINLLRNLQGEEPDLMADLFKWMMRREIEECYERMLCDIASKDQADPSDLRTFLNDEAMFVAEEYQGFAAKLRGALELGEDATNYEVCEEAYECPFNAEEISTQMQLADSTDDN